MVTKRSALVVFLVAVVMLFCSTFAAQPWDMAATVAAALCGTAALLLFLVARAHSGMSHRI
jgi:hypothetical protein